jgi:hypothetical protein
VITGHGKEALVDPNHSRQTEGLAQKRCEPLRSGNKNLQNPGTTDEIRNGIIILIERVELLNSGRFREEIQRTSEKIGRAPNGNSSADKACVCNHKGNDK